MFAAGGHNVNTGAIGHCDKLLCYMWAALNALTAGQKERIHLGRRKPTFELQRAETKPQSSGPPVRCARLIQ